MYLTIFTLQNRDMYFSCTTFKPMLYLFSSNTLPHTSSLPPLLTLRERLEFLVRATLCGRLGEALRSGIHSCVGSEHASLYSRIPETRAAFCCALRCGGRIVDFVHVVAAADIHEVECAGFGCAVGDAAWRQRDYSAHT